MTDQFATLNQDVADVSHAMNKALNEGRMQDFNQMAKKRLFIMKQLARLQHANAPAVRSLMDALKNQNESWLHLILSKKSEIADKRRKNMIRRHGLSHLSNAYASSFNAGKFLVRKG